MCSYLLSATTLEGRMRNGPPLGIFGLNQLEANKAQSKQGKQEKDTAWQTHSKPAGRHFFSITFMMETPVHVASSKTRGSHYCFCCLLHLGGGYMLYYHMAVVIYAATISAGKSDGNANGKIMYESVHKRKNLSQQHNDIQRDCSDSMRQETPRCERHTWALTHA